MVDWSPGGLGVRTPDRPGLERGAHLEVRPLDGGAPRRPLHGRVRSRRPSGEPDGWIRLGLELSGDPWPDPIPVERRKRILGETPAQPAVAMGGSAQPLGSPSLQPRVVRYANEQGEGLCGIVDVFGEARGAPAVVIPSAWGRTKETLMPLADTIVSAFRAAGRPIVVVRFDGVRKRGESHRDPECMAPGAEHHHFTFSQGVRDIQSTLDHLERSPEFGPARTILVSFSAASIVTRRAVATDPRIDGWVCVVGAADTQSMMRVISGGVDYVAGSDSPAAQHLPDNSNGAGDYIQWDFTGNNNGAIGGRVYDDPEHPGARRS